MCKKRAPRLVRKRFGNSNAALDIDASTVGRNCAMVMRQEPTKVPGFFVENFLRIYQTIPHTEIIQDAVLRPRNNVCTEDGGERYLRQPGHVYALDAQVYRQMSSVHYIYFCCSKKSGVTLHYEIACQLQDSL